MFNPHQPVAGPSARPIRPLPLNNLYDASPEKTVNPGSISAPPAIPTVTASDDNDDELDVVPSRGGRKLCVRHKQMANQNVNAKLQKSLDSLPTSERSAITQMWSTFSNAPHARRKLILEGILTMCCFSQLSHLSDSLDQIIRIDPFSLLPREVNLRILGYLDAISLGRAAQVNKSWKALADDDLLWRRMCGQHIDRKCEKCGWGLPLLERKRLKVELKDRSPAAAVSIGHHDHAHHDDHGHGATKVVTRVEALGGKAPEIAQMLSTRTVCDTPVFNVGVKRSAPNSPASSTASISVKRLKADQSDDEGEHTRPKLTRPWKTVYCERLVVERNWRKGRCQMKTLKGHKDGVMCLQYHTSLTSPSYPVLITGSYDRSVKVWNLDTGNEVRTLLGHTRAVRALQFDQMLLFTGSMDGTVRMWNWKAGECLRVLEGHTDGVVSLNYNGYLLASGSADSTINVWNFRTGNKFTLRGHEDWVNAVLLWDGKTSPGDMDPTTPPSFTRARGNASPAPGTPAVNTPNAASISSDSKSKEPEPEIDPGTMLFSGSDDCTVKLWDLTTETCVRTFEGHKAQVQSIKLLMVDMSEGEIAEQQHRRNMRRRAFTPPQTGIVSATQASLTPSPPARHSALDLDVAARAREPHVQPRAYVHPSPEELKKEKVDGADQATRKKKAVLATGSLDGTVKLWDVDSGEEIATLFGHIEGVWGIDMDALRMASASHDRTIKVWDRESGNCEQTLVGHRGAVTSLQLSDDMIVSGSDDGDVMVWNFGPNSSSQNGNGVTINEGTPTPGVEVANTQGKVDAAA